MSCPFRTRRSWRADASRVSHRRASLLCARGATVRRSSCTPTSGSWGTRRLAWRGAAKTCLRGRLQQVAGVVAVRTGQTPLRRLRRLHQLLLAAVPTPPLRVAMLPLVRREERFRMRCRIGLSAERGRATTRKGGFACAHVLERGARTRVAVGRKLGACWLFDSVELMCVAGCVPRRGHRGRAQGRRRRSVRSSCIDVSFRSGGRD
mmetsp:Transcript_35738/g.87914  ORF Transcript_35738/g.87914 Transcript_35738/m.87914 type:complete len:206 (-) Transcript_35738:144-761(-)